MSVVMIAVVVQLVSIVGNVKKQLLYIQLPSITRNEIGDYLKFAIEEAIKKDYYDSDSRNLDSYMRGVF